MCTEIMVCHGDKVKETTAFYSEEQKQSVCDDCKPATYYITNDGKYAVDADYVDINNLDKLDLDNVPKIKIKD